VSLIFLLIFSILCLRLKIKCKFIMFFIVCFTIILLSSDHFYSLSSISNNIYLRLLDKIIDYIIQYKYIIFMIWIM